MPVLEASAEYILMQPDLVGGLEVELIRHAAQAPALAEKSVARTAEVGRIGIPCFIKDGSRGGDAAIDQGRG